MSFNISNVKGGCHIFDHIEMTNLQGNFEWYAQHQPAANNEKYKKQKPATPPRKTQSEVQVMQSQ